jgi:hypothetical protein
MMGRLETVVPFSKGYGMKVRGFILALVAVSSPAYAQNAPPYNFPGPGAPQVVPMNCTETALVQCSPSSSLAPSVMTEREEARILAGFGYTVSSSIVSVSSGNYLNASLANPSNSGVTLVMTSRVLNCNIASGATPSEYGRFATGSTFPASPTPTIVAVGNRRAGGAASTAVFQFQMATTPLAGTQSSGGFVPTGGNRLDIKEIVLIPPGQTLLYSMGGSGGGLAATARCAITFLFYTVPV